MSEVWLFWKGTKIFMNVGVKKQGIKSLRSDFISDSFVGKEKNIYFLGFIYFSFVFYHFNIIIPRYVIFFFSRDYNSRYVH